MILGRLRLFSPAAVGLAIFVGGCANESQHRILAQTIAPARASQIAKTHELFIATSRARDEAPGVVFAGNRSPDPMFGRVEISVPAVHEPGRIEYSPTNKVADPARYFAARRIGLYRSEAGFAEDLREDLAEGSGRALVFVHGYNTGFDEAIYRMTQIVHDSGFTGTPVLFTWASAARTIDYIYDSNSAAAARDALEETLLTVARSGATRIDIIAHSMGSWVTMETLRQLAIAGNKDLNGKLGDVVLASPDIDADLFKLQMRRYGAPVGGFYALTSRDDRALSLSQLIAGNQPRVGATIDAEELSLIGVTVIDVTGVASTDRLNHTKFAENPLLIRLLGDTLVADAQPTSEQEITERLDRLASGIGQTIGSAAELIITTPFQVFDVEVGQR
ncbi:alpha/beta hydrolase [Nitratireductor luteus]|uniref:alpha/beta hydrolase n=1 Tax=Nitratireductor luteus TaxID=2976980 RepID=UPI00223FC72D|nr:alpha/beta hydrolase [Nitratireductor luteus]